MSNVVKFPKRVRRPALDRAGREGLVRVPRVDDPKATNGFGLRSPLRVFLAVLQVPLFLVLYWLRLPVMLLCQLVSVPMLFAFLFTLYAFPDKTPMVVGFGVVSFVAFAVLWTYDLVLMALSPQDMMRTL
jgi:hypothetical protein